MTHLLEVMFRSFWTFIGTIILISLIGEFIFTLVNRVFRHWNIRKHGYPPIWCDADGDFRSKKK